MKVTVKFRIVAVIFFAFMLVHSASAKADELYFVDAHSQVDDTVVPLNTVISLMKQGGVTHTLRKNISNKVDNTKIKESVTIVNYLNVH